jgi:hypothetical protein
MGFASAYLQERAIFPAFVKEVPDKQTGIIVVVPAYNEPGIGKLLDSMAKCRIPECKVEVIIVVNSPEGPDKRNININETTLINIESWRRENINCFFRLFAFIARSDVSRWGVGLARKTGMDEALRRFDLIDNPDGTILCLDADCLVEQNYFVSVCDDFLKKRERSACSIYFEHPLSGTDFPQTVYNSITLYELHLRYYYQGLAYTRFPWVFHTVGSAIAVKALPYVKAGGMNRRQAGEDFYFVQKLVPAGGYVNLNSTTVFPSPRTSSRVPFGTGASITKLTGEDSSILLTYNLQAFDELRTFFSDIDDLYKCNQEELDTYYRSLPVGLRSFSDETDWKNKILEIKNNTSGLSSFRKRFFGWFNMFRIVKYLNYVHLGCFEKMSVEAAASELLDKIGIHTGASEAVSLLQKYRLLEKNI